MCFVEERKMILVSFMLVGLTEKRNKTPNPHIPSPISHMLFIYPYLTPDVLPPFTGDHRHLWPQLSHQQRIPSAAFPSIIFTMTIKSFRWLNLIAEVP